MLHSVTGLYRITENTQVLLGYWGITDICKYYWITGCTWYWITRLQDDPDAHNTENQ